jgi:hypothetical protein
MVKPDAATTPPTTSLVSRELVLAAPMSTVGIVVPSVRHFVDVVEVAGAQIAITGTLTLSLVDGRYPGGYLLTEVTLADGQGLTPELIRLVPWNQVIGPAIVGDMRVVTYDPETHELTQHPHPMATLGPDELVVLAWLVARFSHDDTNRYIAQELGITPNAAAQRVARLRKAGQLPPATPGERRF